MASNQPGLNYANAAKSEFFPTKDFAIIIDAVEGITIREYTIAISTKVQPSSIRFISRIANNRICVYLSSKAIADELIYTHKSISINNLFLPIRPLISRNKRIVLSNVPPIIPHSVLQETLRNLKVETTSTFTFLRAGLNDPGLSHIMSFRRQVFINPDDINKIPEQLAIRFDDTNYHVFVSSDSFNCFACHQPGHQAKECPNLPGTKSSSREVPDDVAPPVNLNNERPIAESSSQSLTTELPPSGVGIRTTVSPSPLSSPDSHNDISDGKFVEPASPLVPLSLLRSKRILSSSSDASAVSKNEEKMTKRSVNKKAKKEPALARPLPSNLEDLMANRTPPFPCNFNQLQNLLDKTSGQHVIQHIIVEDKLDPMETALMLRNLYPALDSRGLKVKFTKLIKKIESEFDCKSLDKSQLSDTSERDFSDVSCSDLENDVATES